VIRVVLVDDQALVRTGLRMVLEAEPDIEVVGEAADGLQAVEAARLRPDLMLMDIRMPNLDGIEATRRLAGSRVVDPVRVLVLTTYDVDEYVFEALRAGACGFLLKHTSPEGLVEAVRTVASGDGLIAPAVTRRLIAEIARELVVGPATVKTHVGRVLTKLGLRDRVEAVIWAYEAGVVQPGR
jgi:DNA-binding NarL/FixJ family response regulator